MQVCESAFFEIYIAISLYFYFLCCQITEYFKVKMQFPFIYLIVFCLLVILFLVWYIQRTKQRKKFLEQEHKYDQALLEVHAIETEYYISLLRDKQEETQKLLSQKENEIRKLADEKAQLCNVIFKETSIYKTIMSRRNFVLLLWRYTRTIQSICTKPILNIRKMIVYFHASQFVGQMILPLLFALGMSISKLWLKGGIG